LIALGGIAQGEVLRRLPDLGLNAERWKKGLVAQVCRGGAGSVPLTAIEETKLDSTASDMLRAAGGYCAKYGLPKISERVLLLSALENLTERVGKLFKTANVDTQAWCERLRRDLEPVRDPVRVFGDDQDQTLIEQVFSPTAQRVLSLLRRETEALGYDVADTRHLLLAMLLSEGSSIQYGLHQQSILPKTVQESVTISLQAKARRTRSTITLTRPHLQAALCRVLSLAGEVAAREKKDLVLDAHLCRAFLDTESVARRILEDQKVDLLRLEQAAEHRQSAEEEEAEKAESMTIADIETVRDRLKAALVGQDEAIEHILPHVQRLRFGFTTPNKPVGVFLFCGQSGSGKTEMAKGLARAVYGTEENLIFLEMGQFNAPESMNIFVGAPPGYVGYGQGKLTNGLRDKPSSVVLFDEVEKAHPKVLDALLRFLDEGRIDDPAGPVRDGTQCLVVLTSNVGSQELSRLWTEIEGEEQKLCPHCGAGIGKAKDGGERDPNWKTMVRRRLREEFEKHRFRVEFLNRVDELILFRTLRRKDYVEIANRLLKRDLERLERERQIAVVADSSVGETIGGYCNDIAEGARAAHRLVQTVVITPVIDHVLRNQCKLPVNLKVRAVRAKDEPGCEPHGIVEKG
jgi:ATP-dependent Clp protease ATP-binding subunit ClpC